MAREALSTRLARANMKLSDATDREQRTAKKAEKISTELTEAQTALRREQAKVQFLGDNLTKIVERFHSLRVVHGDCNATAALAAMQQEINGYNGQLNAIAQADIVG